MKCALILVGLTVIVAVQAFGLESCVSQVNCEPDECCVKGVVKNFCKKRLEEGKLCHAVPIKVGKKKEVYIGKCPCLEGLECKNNKEGGVIGNMVYKCTAETTEPTEEPEPEPEPESE